MPQRFSKDSVKYTDSGTDAEHCSICTHYLNPTTCAIVVGRIVPRGWCEKFEKQTQSPMQRSPA